VALDVSVAAARRAARVDPVWVTSVVADAWQPWPVLDGVAAAVLSVFGPRNAAESARVLVPGGRFVVVVPAADHLRELREPLGLLGIEPGKLARLRDETAAHLTFRDVQEVRATTTVTRDEATAIAGMGPSAHHVAADEFERRSGALAEQFEVTVAVHVVRFEQGAHARV
jgi:23S rRNA (guanine745-N1)-methyltransferase